jgi:hypothetical protein
VINYLHGVCSWLRWQHLSISFSMKILVRNALFYVQVSNANLRPPEFGTIDDLPSLSASGDRLGEYAGSPLGELVRLANDGGQQVLM